MTCCVLAALPATPVALAGALLKRWLLHASHAWQVVVDANAERRPRTGPVPPCLSSEQWAERIAGVMTEALG